MTYKGKLKSGEELLLKNDGTQTRIEVRTKDSASHASQSSSFDSGKWQGTPQLWSVADSAVLQIETKQNSEFFQIAEHGIRHLEVTPDLQDAKPLELVESDETVNEVPLEPLPPMKAEANGAAQALEIEGWKAIQSCVDRYELRDMSYRSQNTVVFPYSVPRIKTNETAERLWGCRGSRGG